MAGEGNPSGYAITMATGAGTAGSNTFGMSNLGNTSGTTGVVAGAPVRYLFAGGNNITLSQSINGSSATLTISAFNESQSIGMSNVGNTAGTTGPASGSNVRYIFAGGNNVTLSQSVNGASGSLSIAAGGTLGAYWPYFGNMVSSQIGNGSIQIWPFTIPEFMTATQANFFIANSISTSSNSSHAGTLSVQFVIYTLSGSTLSSVSSGSTNYAWTNTSDNSTASLNLIRLLAIPINVSATPGMYWGGFWSRTTTANANWITLSNMLWQNSAAFGGVFATGISGSAQMMPGYGVYSASSASIITSAAIGDIVGTAGPSRNIPTMNFVSFSA